ncbi:hypothetical protein [Halomonas urumqiensis]|uniref:hypothetical protein n=1 Tax=Halomonas urumqiensis TaxID=1684789 RepID=UPI0016732A6D|nr:hypothetical protein [Halomonas urumqiensis]
MTEKQFQISCKVIYQVTVIILVLQIVACAMMLWMTWSELPRHEDVTILLGGSVLASCVYSWVAKKPFFKREEVDLGVGGTTGIMHSLATNIFWWCGYHFMELVFLVPAIKICFQAIWFS